MSEVFRKQSSVFVVTRGGLWQMPYRPIAVFPTLLQAQIYLGTKQEVLLRDGFVQLLFDSQTLRMYKRCDDGSFEEASFIITETEYHA